MGWTQLWVLGAAIAGVACVADWMLFRWRRRWAVLPLVLLAGALLLHMVIPGNQWDPDVLLVLAFVGGLAWLLSMAEWLAALLLRRFLPRANGAQVRQFGVRFVWWMVLPFTSALLARGILYGRMDPLLREDAVMFAELAPIAGCAAVALSVALMAIPARRG